MGVWAEIGFTHSNLWVLCNDNVLRRNQPRTSAICRQHVFAGVAAVAVSAFSALGCPSHASAEELLPTAYVRAAVAVLHEPKMLSCVNEFLDVDCVAVPERLVWSGARPLILKQGWSLEQRSTGVVVWQCAPALVEYLQTRLPHKYFSGQRVLELGTGTGFTSIFLALMGSYVTGTDGDTGLLDRRKSPAGLHVHVCCRVPRRDEQPKKALQGHFHTSASPVCDAAPSSIGSRLVFLQAETKAATFDP